MLPEGRVWIDQIVVENLGPIGDRTFELGPINLVFGRNEAGKTCLIEFLLRALFRYAGEWGLRSEIGQGKVWVKGLAPEAVEFTPGGRRKLEDFWSGGESGLPTNMGRLLVVKGGELDFDRHSAGGVDRAVLKSVLSNESLLDRILEPMQETVKKARVVGGVIEGHDKGELQDRSRILSDLRRLERLVEQVDSGMSLGHIRSLELRLDQINSSLRVQLEAKRHQAYQLNKAWLDARKSLEALPEDQVGRMIQLLRDLRRLDADIEQSAKDLAGRQSESHHHGWVEQAISLWQERQMTGTTRAPWLMLIGAGASIALAAGLALFDQSVAAAIAAAGGLGLGILGVWLLTRTITHSVDQAGRAELVEEFERRFGKPLTNLAQLKAVESDLRKTVAIAEEIERRHTGLQAERTRLAAELGRGLALLSGRVLDVQEWDAVLGELAAKRRSLSDEIHQLEMRLESLGVDASDFAEQPTEVEYSKVETTRLESQQEQLQIEIARANAELQGLKQAVCNETGDGIDRSWGEILGSLWKLREEKAAEYRQKTSRILAQIGVTEVLARIAAEEDERIRKGLNDEAVRRVLNETTQRYRSLDLQNDGLVVSSDTVDYNLSELSTGAREQVLLALRMGFASRLAGGQPLFMLLDDAFQHSDWERRVRLVEQVLNMVQAGWQVTYLTMDDHLRDLFDTAAKKALDGDYRLHTIEV